MDAHLSWNGWKALEGQAIHGIIMTRLERVEDVTWVIVTESATE